MEIVFSYPIWYLFLCFLLGGILSYALYRKDSALAENPKWVNGLMAGMRFILISALSVFLLKPLVNVENRIIEKPIIVFLQDNSESILVNSDSSFYKNDYPQKINSLKEKLSEKFEVRSYDFGSTLRDSNIFSFDEKLTSFNEVKKELESSYYGRNLGAVIIASDGIYNKGNNPTRILGDQTTTSLFTIALGDTSIRKDAIIKEVANNDIAYLGNDFPIEVAVSGQQLNDAKLMVSVLKDEKLLASESLVFSGNNDIQTIPFKINASEPGKQRYRIAITELDGELTYENNVSDVFIEVIDNKQNILIVHNGPHPDVGAIRSALSKNLNYDVTSKKLENCPTSLDEYNLIVLHQFPSASGTEKIRLDAILESGKPVLFIVGNQSNISSFNKSKFGISVVAPRKTTTSKATVNGSFSGFVLENEVKNLIQELPPLQVPFASDFAVSAQFKTLLYQKIGNTTTDYPLIGFSEKNGNKYGFILGEGIWRWRFQDYIKNKNSNAFDALINKSAQFLAVKENKEKFRLNINGEFLENENIVFQGECYNDIYELINEPEVLLNIKTENGEELPQKVLSRVGKGYRLDVGRLPAGNYSFTSSVNLNGTKKEIQGEFLVKELRLEYNNVVADHNLLFQLANDNNGAMFYPNQLEDLVTAINANTNIANVSYVNQDQEDLIQWKWIFAILLIFLSIEWFMRKRFGAY